MRVRSGKIKKDEQCQQIPGDAPQQARVGKQRALVHVARRPWHDRLGDRPSNLVHLSGDDAAWSRIDGSAEDVEIALDHAFNGGVAEDDGQIAFDDLARFDDDGSEIDAAVIDGARIGERGTHEQRTEYRQ